MAEAAPVPSCWLLKKDSDALAYILPCTLSRGAVKLLFSCFGGQSGESHGRFLVIRLFLLTAWEEMAPKLKGSLILPRKQIPHFILTSS